MDRRILKTVSEQIDTTTVMFNDSDGYSIEDIASAFAGFSTSYDSFESAIDHLPNFVSQFYSGNNVTKFKDTIRMGYADIVDAIFDGVRPTLEKRVVRSI